MSDEVQMNDAASTMFGAPRWSPDERYDVVFVGVPSDLGGLGHRSPATAPSFLRTTSQLFPLVHDGAGNAKGWFDYSTRTDLLRGVTMADAGDFPVSRASGLRALEPLASVYETLRESASLVVVIGGDHSISHFLAPALHDEGLVWMDAHEDASPKDGPYPHCANVVSYLDELDNVRAIAQYGLRGIVPADRPPVGPRRRLCGSAEEVVETLRSAAVRSAAVSIDVDVFDPSVMPAVGSAMPEGLRSHDVLRVLRSLRQANIAVPFLELAEFAPLSETDVTSALFLVNFLLRAIAVTTCLPT